MNFIFSLVMAVVMGCVQVVFFIANIALAIVMGIVMTIVFIPVLLFNLWNDSRDDDAKF